jgi:CBS domain containing-hemolysin-like protein
MSALELTLRLAAGVLLVMGNALFVLTEFALTRARHVGRSEFSGTPALDRAWKMTEELEIYLTGCQLGISTMSVLLGVVAEPGVTALIAPLGELVGLEGGALRLTSVTVSVFVINLIHKIWGEQAPTYFGVEAPVKAARLGAPILHVWTKLFFPLVMLGDGLAKGTLRLFGLEVTRSWVDDEVPDAPRGPQDLRRVVLDAMVQSKVPHDRRQEVLGALDLDRIPTKDIMVPREELAVLRNDATFERNLNQMGRTAKTRYPLVGDDLDDVLGVIYAPLVFRHLAALQGRRLSLADIAVAPLWADAETPVSELIDVMQDAGQELALVACDGALIGAVTITDAFECIAGDVTDPTDDEIGHDVC